MPIRSTGGTLAPRVATRRPGPGPPSTRRAVPPVRRMFPLLAMLLGALVAPPMPALAQDTQSELSGDQIAQRINARDEGRAAIRRLTIDMIDSAGKKRTRVTTVLRRTDPDAKRTVIHYHEPANVKGTAFLNVDYLEPGRDDDRWIYLPAMRKVRRIAASDRGDYFFGTDFTYEDINNETKVNIDDYTRRRVGTERLDDVECLVMEALPVSETVAAELGYSRVLSWVDPQIWMLRRVDYWDRRGQLLKTIRFLDIRQVQEKWTAHRLEAENRQTGHRTILRFEKVEYAQTLEDGLFTIEALQRGL